MKNKEKEVDFNKIGVKNTTEENNIDYSKRNELFLSFFKNIVFPDRDVIILGDKKNPAIIIDNQYLLSCYMPITKEDIIVNFMDKNRNGNRIFDITLTEPLKKEDIEAIHDWYKKYEHRKVYRLILETKNESTEPTLLLAGWNYKDKEKSEGKYPVFGEHNPKIYITKEKATEVEKELKDSGYNITII